MTLPQKWGEVYLKQSDDWVCQSLSSSESPLPPATNKSLSSSEREISTFPHFPLLVQSGWRFSIHHLLLSIEHWNKHESTMNTIKRKKPIFDKQLFDIYELLIKFCLVFTQSTICLWMVPGCVNSIRWHPIKGLLHFVEIAMNSSQAETATYDFLFIYLFDNLSWRWKVNLQLYSESLVLEMVYMY